ncbi:hypothetical protein Rhe02_83460 [Rhizocola hellebori]|uniref:Uncharacterized protein n=2 Tax=Rhizocola hellebori TaxID=1392758 RepID=A0A8J3QIC2_9ACTN|nr:hypothetical protein Rhe02_83460 [Rhizocola hellebori]
MLIVFSRGHLAALERPLPSRAPSRRGISVRFAGVSFASWALADRATGSIIGAENLAEPGDTMSMIKAWIAADFLRRDPNPDEADLEQLSVMIRDSDNDVAVDFHHRNGEKISIDRMIFLCGLTDSHAGRVTYRWSDTVMSARDVARLGLCLADGRAAGEWTDWLLGEMRLVRGDGDFGPRKALPAAVAAKVAVKNGWFSRPEDGLWHFACLAIGDSWTLGVLLRYPAELGEEHGHELCRAAGEQLLPLLSPGS